MNEGKALAKDLALALARAKWMTWQQMPLGSVFAGCGIADLVAIRHSYADPRVTIYEVKTSKADFYRDVRANKYVRYLDHCNRLYFAAPVGLITSEQIPVDAGLIVHTDKGWRVRKGAPCRDVKLDSTFLMALLMKGYTDFRAGAPLL